MAELGRVWFVTDAGLGAIEAAEDAPDWVGTHVPLVLVCSDERLAARAGAFGSPRRTWVVMAMPDVPPGDALVAAMDAAGVDFWQFCVRPCLDYAAATARVARLVDEGDHDAIIVELIRQAPTGFHLTAASGLTRRASRCAVLATPECCFLGSDAAIALADGLTDVPDTASLALALDAALGPDPALLQSPLLAGVLFEIAEEPAVTQTAALPTDTIDTIAPEVVDCLRALRVGAKMPETTLDAEMALLADGCVADMLGWAVYSDTSPDRDRRAALHGLALDRLGVRVEAGKFALAAQSAGATVANSYDATDVWRARAASVHGARAREQIRNRRLGHRIRALQARLDDLNVVSSASSAPVEAADDVGYSVSSSAKDAAPIIAALADAASPREALEKAERMGADGASAAAITIYSAIVKRWPSNRRAAVQISRWLESEGKAHAAARALAPALAGKNVPVQLYRRAWNLARRSDDGALTREIAARARAAFPDESWPAEAMIRILRDTGRFEEMVALALSVPAGLVTDPAIALMTYAAAREISSTDETDNLRNRFVATIASASDAELWEKRLARLEGAAETPRPFDGTVEAERQDASVLPI